MSKLLRMGFIFGIVAFVFSANAFADQSNGKMGICGADWIPNGSTYCTPATPTNDFGTTANSNPTFNIAVNSGSPTSTDLVILVPNTNGVSTLQFTATFQLYNSSGQAVGSPVTVSAVSPVQFTAANGTLLAGALGLPISNTGDYTFSSVQSHELASTSSYSVFYLPTTIALSSANQTGEYVTVTFNFTSGSGFPYGTIFLALGDTNGTITQTTPWTTSLQETVPEPMSLSLFGTGLLGIAMMVRRRMRKSA